MDVDSFPKMRRLQNCGRQTVKGGGEHVGIRGKRHGGANRCCAPCASTKNSLRLAASVPGDDIVRSTWPGAVG